MQSVRLLCLHIYLEVCWKTYSEGPENDSVNQMHALLLSVSPGPNSQSYMGTARELTDGGAAFVSPSLTTPSEKMQNEKQVIEKTGR